MPPVTAVSRSASSRMTLADLPPSSRATRFTVPAAIAAIRLPARVDPVNEIMSTSGWDTSASPMSGPLPLTRLKTPVGSPISSKISASAKTSSGVTSVGLTTTVHPAAKAAATLRATWCSGKFHGVMQPTTPTGSRTIKELPTSTPSKS